MKRGERRRKGSEKDYDMIMEAEEHPIHSPVYYPVYTHKFTHIPLIRLLQ